MGAGTEGIDVHQLKKALAALATMLCMTTGAHAADDFLDPADAFRVSASLDASGTAVQVAVEVAPGYHLYADSLRLTGERDVRFGAMRRPAGEVRYDEALKKPREQYAGTVAIVAPVYGAAGAFELAVDSQGCADSGLCYPPTTTRVALSLPRTIAPADGAARTVAAGGPADASAAAGGGTGASAGERVDPGPRSVAVAVGQAAELDRIASTLARGDLLSIALLFAGLGALLSLTPWGSRSAIRPISRGPRAPCCSTSRGCSAASCSAGSRSAPACDASGSRPHDARPRATALSCPRADAASVRRSRLPCPLSSGASASS